MNWKTVASELVDAMLLMEDTEQVVERLLSLMPVDVLKSTDWFEDELIDEVQKEINEGGTFF